MEKTIQNELVLDELLRTFMIAFSIIILVGICQLGLLAEAIGAIGEFVAYAFIGLVGGGWAAYGRYLMTNYWIDEEE